jgi:hypothetical protein
MNRNAVRAHPNEFRNVSFRPLNQKVDVQNQVCRLAQTSDNWLAHADIGHKVPVHHIDVNHGRPCLFY